MSALAVHAPSLLPPPRDMMWESRRAERIELPSIRQALPEIYRGRPESDYRPCSPSSLAPLHEGPPSPSFRKRRRLSDEDDLDDARDRSVPRIHRSPRAYPSSTTSPMSNSRRASVLSMAESWTSSTRTSPHTLPRGPPAPSPFDASSIARSDWRPQLPSLPAPNFERAVPRAPGSWDERGFDAAPLSAPPTEPPPTHSLPAPYPYPQTRGLSYSGPSTSPGSPHYRVPFSNIHPAGFTGYPYLADAADGEGKQRRRRGNLPKETTDKLRAWFLAHLGHPYPAEDEKQELMRQTGLQMNQISNWFINARRRQLPALTKTARGSEAKAGEGARQETGDGEKAPSGESEGEGSSYDDCEGLGRRCGPGMVKRESI